MSDFVAVDLETATSSHNSSCAIGIVVVQGGEITHSEGWLIRPPENHYEDINIRIHGITADQTENSPNFPEVWELVQSFIGDSLVVAHSAASADMSFIRKSSNHYDFTPPNFSYVCSRDMARLMWPNRLSYRLKDLSKEFEIELNHHDPVSDARAAAKLALLMCEELRMASLEDAAFELGYFPRPFSIATSREGSKREGIRAVNAQEVKARLAKVKGVEISEDIGSLRDKTLLFTGKLSLMNRKEAKLLAQEAGASTVSGVSNKVDYLVVGQQDSGKVGDDGRSNKMKKAEELKATGHHIEIIDEVDFYLALENSN